MSQATAGNRNWTLKPPISESPKTRLPLYRITCVFNAARFAEAAALAQTLTAQFPGHWFGWKALGASYREIGRSADAVAPMRKAVELIPGDAEAHSNLGNVLQDLGQFDDLDSEGERILKDSK